MTDTVDKQTRSKMMSTVRGKNTKLEIALRRSLFARGFRYRLHAHDLPGRPDMVLPKYSAVIFVHGCFWHLHDCERSTIPQNRREWWQKKLQDNRDRDARALDELRRKHWRVLIIWECSIRRPGVNYEKALSHACIGAENFLRSKTKFREISGPLRNNMPERQVGP